MDMFQGWMEQSGPPLTNGHCRVEHFVGIISIDSFGFSFASLCVTVASFPNSTLLFIAQLLVASTIHCQLQVRRKDACRELSSGHCDAPYL